jgi:hypothetical protein
MMEIFTLEDLKMRKYEIGLGKELGINFLYLSSIHFSCHRNPYAGQTEADQWLMDLFSSLLFESLRSGKSDESTTQ